MSVSPILETRNLEVGYAESLVLRDINLRIPEGAITAVMGRNGVGKTTLMKALVGLLKPASGSICFQDKDVTSLPPEKRARLGLGYVPQGREIFSKLTVEENLKIGTEALGGRKASYQEDLIYDLFPVLGKMGNRLGGNLSGGQQQQLAIARALAGAPSVLVLDEPTEGIQPSIIQDIEAALIRLKDTGGLTIILVEQYFEFAHEIADYFCIMDRGSVTLSGARDEVEAETIKAHLTF